MRQQLSDQLCFQDITEPVNLASRTKHLEWASSTGTTENFQSSKTSGNPEFDIVGCVGGKDTNNSLEASGRADASSPVNLRFNPPSLVDLGPALGDCDVPSKDPEISNDDAMNKDVVLVETPTRKDVNSGDLHSLHERNSLFEKCAGDEEKWYVNPMVNVSDDYYDLCTSERVSPIFSSLSPVIRRSFELAALRSSIRKGDKWKSDTRLSPLAEFSPASPLQVMYCYQSKFWNILSVLGATNGACHLIVFESVYTVSQ